MLRTKALFWNCLPRLKDKNFLICELVWCAVIGRLLSHPCTMHKSGLEVVSAYAQAKPIRCFVQTQCQKAEQESECEIRGHVAGEKYKTRTSTMTIAIIQTLNSKDQANLERHVYTSPTVFLYHAFLHDRLRPDPRIILTSLLLRPGHPAFDVSTSIYTFIEHYCHYSALNANHCLFV